MYVSTYLLNFNLSVGQFPLFWVLITVWHCSFHIFFDTIIYESFLGFLEFSTPYPKFGILVLTYGLGFFTNIDWSLIKVEIFGKEFFCCNLFIFVLNENKHKFAKILQKALATFHVSGMLLRFHDLYATLFGISAFFIFGLFWPYTNFYKYLTYHSFNNTGKGVISKYAWPNTISEWYLSI